MKKYLLFAGWNYYPSGGMNDYIGSFNTFEEANAVGINKKSGADVFDWHHVVLHETMERVEE